ncbi:hypothetical protein LEP1GSC059_1989 [Leptospira noguchii serovar Panama str. CZ214]|uniref:Uncharacterized protein n=1 Tax=Leptospira noguchii serovar Panama str. CZ214 TaxID=1001595 RepID=T0GMI9_9LEPT|nr:hypothetical protein LEP1GSC059_1989 [Leptospira noguchii serovar Panama str. CZ214]
MKSGLYGSIPKFVGTHTKSKCLKICNVTKFVGTTANRNFTN